MASGEGRPAGRPVSFPKSFLRREGMTEQAESERYMNAGRRWFTEGWAGNVALADDIFSENVRTNGVAVGVAGPKRRIQERLAGFPDLSTHIVDMFSAGDKVVT